MYANEDGAVAINLIIDSKNDISELHRNMAELFGKNINTISKHLTNIFGFRELIKSKVTFNLNDSTNSGIVIINLDDICQWLSCKHQKEQSHQ